MITAADRYLEKALEAEERARSTLDPQLKARWLGIAFGYRELARYRNSLPADALPVDLAKAVSQDENSPASRTPS